MITEMTCYTYLGHIRNPRIYAAPPPNYSHPPSNTVLGRQEKMPKNRIGRGAVLEGGSPIF